MLDEVRDKARERRIAEQGDVVEVHVTATGDVKERLRIMKLIHELMKREEYWTASGGNSKKETTAHFHPKGTVLV